MPRLLSEAEVVGTDIWIKAYSYALVLTTRSPEKTFNTVKNKATKKRVGYVVFIQPLLCSLTYGVPHDRYNGYIGFDIYIYRREVRSCSFRQYGQFSGALSSEASDEWASRFLFIWFMLSSYYNFDAKPHRTLKHL